MEPQTTPPPDKPASDQRKILAWFVLIAVLISFVRALLYGTYYTSVEWLWHLIAAAYALMLIGYTLAHLPDVIRGEVREAMRKLGIFLVLVCASFVLAQGPQTKPPLAVSPSYTVPVTTITDMKADDKLKVTLSPVGQLPNNCPLPQIDVEGPSQKAFSFSIPPDACVGLYKLTVTAQGAAPVATADKPSPTAPPARNIDVSSPQYLQVNAAPPEVNGIWPKALYREGDSQWTLVFLGPPTLKSTGDYTLSFAGHGLLPCAVKDKTKVPVELIDPKESEFSCFKRTSSQDGQVAFIVGGRRFLSDFAGKQSAALVQNGTESAAQDLFVIDATRNAPRNYAIGITLALVLLIYLLLRAGGRTMQTESEKRSYFLKALFIDDQTDTYSLSKCQFYAWTFAAILGYIFFAVARSIIQGSAVFPDVPGGLPGILLYSAGTSVLATGITSAKGSKGSGEIHPTLADFITTGGVVAPERLQFVVWTVAGVFTFLTIVFKSDPLTLSDLPRIPDGFMNLMGISAAGYLAGKLARKPGPVIAALAVEEVAAADLLSKNKPPASSAANGRVTGKVITLSLQGEGLNPNASIKVDGNPLRADEFWINGTPDPQTGFCKNVTVSLNGADVYLEGTHTLTYVNPDAQAADATFPIDPMTIDSLDPLPPAPAADPPKISVKGKNLRPGTKYKYRWTTADGSPVTAGDVAKDDISDGEMKVPRSEAVIAGCRLTLTSEVGLQASYPKTSS